MIQRDSISLLRHLEMGARRQILFAGLCCMMALFVPAVASPAPVPRGPGTPAADAPKPPGPHIAQGEGSNPNSPSSPVSGNGGSTHVNVEPGPEKPEIVEKTDGQLIDEPVPVRLGRVDPNRGLYPDSSLADFSRLLDAPAGQHGFLSTRTDGHFHWANGDRARFWGVCVSRRNAVLPHPEIARIATVFARAGCNLVRFENLDGDNGILYGSQQDSQHLDMEFLDALQFWMACLRARGIYYYLDLLDFRRFTPGDGVVNAKALGRAAKPYAIFDDRLITLQQDYARQLLLSVNPYTHLRPVDDPALVMVELVNEHGLFMDVTVLDKLVEPYEGEFKTLWNAWLLRRYASRDALNAHWSAAHEPLSPTENPEEGTVIFTPMPSSESGYGEGGVRSARIRDQVDFLAETQRAFFRTMRDFLRHIGLRCPITAAVTTVVGRDVLTVADELDCTAENYYADHPKLGANGWAGAEYFLNQNPLRSSGAYESAPQLAVLRWNNKPVVIREWDTAFPNQFRATSVPDVAAYASLQDLDMLVLFTYVTGPRSSKLDDFEVGSDPTVWGLFGLGSQVFLGGLISPARFGVDLLYGKYDLEQWGPYLSQLHRLAWCSRVRNVSSGAVLPPQSGISVLSGRGGDTTLPTRNALAFQRLDAVPQADRFSAVENMIKSNGISLTVSPVADQVFKFNGLIYDTGSVTMESEAGFLLSDLQAAGFTAIGVDAERQMAFGAYDPARHVMVLPLVSAETALRASLDLLHEIGAPVSRELVEADRWHSDTGEITRDPNVGRLLVEAPRTLMIAGEFPKDSDVEDGALTLRTSNTDGALVMESLDDHSLPESQHWILKLVTHAENTGQVLEAAPADAPAPYVLKAVGTSPILTGGEQSDAPTTVKLDGHTLIEIGMTGGTWEFYRDGDHYQFACDTPGVHVHLRAEGRILSVLLTGAREIIKPAADGSFTYPDNALAIEILPLLPISPHDRQG